MVKKIEREKNRLIREKNVCVENFISKEYYSIDDLKIDNNKEVEVDKDKLRIGESKFVTLNSFALLHLDGKKRLFKRIELSSGEHMWNLESGINIEYIIEEYKKSFSRKVSNKIYK